MEQPLMAGDNHGTLMPGLTGTVVLYVLAALKITLVTEESAVAAVLCRDGK